MPLVELVLGHARRLLFGQSQQTGGLGTCRTARDRAKVVVPVVVWSRVRRVHRVRVGRGSRAGAVAEPLRRAGVFRRGLRANRGYMEGRKGERQRGRYRRIIRKVRFVDGRIEWTISWRAVILVEHQ